MSDEYFLTDHVCNADRQKAEAAAGMEATESNMQTRAASALESVIQEDGDQEGRLRKCPVNRWMYKPQLL